MSDERTMYKMTFKKGYGGAVERIVNLPNGGRKKMNMLQKDKSAEDYPSVVTPMSPEDVRQYALHGFECKPLKQPKDTKEK
jgi:hypothetical protein